MTTTSIKGVLSFCVAVTVTVVMAYSAVTVIQKNNAATEKAVKEFQAIGSEVPQIALRMENTRVPLPAMVDLLLSASPLRVEN